MTRLQRTIIGIVLLAVCVAGVAFAIKMAIRLLVGAALVALLFWMFRLLTNGRD